MKFQVRVARKILEGKRILCTTTLTKKKVKRMTKSKNKMMRLETQNTLRNLKFTKLLSTILSMNQ